jgi:endonuclease/exonuclease/phosphatase family metal-dependent hydrolase
MDHAHDLLVPVLVMKLRILSYNIHKGFDLWGRFTLEDMKQALLETHADVLFLQEVVGENKELLQHFKSAPNEKQFEYLADTVWPHYSYGKNAVFPARHHGNAILSKYPIVSTHNLDISTNRYESRGLLHAQIDLIPAAKPLHLFCTHLNLLEGSRILQTRQVIEWIQKQLHSDTAFLLAGDFNDWTENLTDLFSESLAAQESFQHLFGRHAQSYPSLWPQLRLDRVYFRGLQIREAQVLRGLPWTQLSDHLPLLVEFEIE